MLKNINKVVRVIVTADFFYNSAFAAFGPVFAIFVINNIQGGSAKVVGLATAIFWITKSLFQLPIASFLVIFNRIFAEGDSLCDSTVNPSRPPFLLTEHIFNFRKSNYV